MSLIRSLIPQASPDSRSTASQIEFATWTLDRIPRRPRHQVETDPRPSPRLRLPDDGAELDRRTHPPQSYAGDPDRGRRTRRVDARALGGREGDAAAVDGTCGE